MRRAATHCCCRDVARYGLASLACAVLIVGCGPEVGPEDALRQWVNTGQEAVQAGDRRGLLRLISPAYADARGLGREDIDDRLRVYFLRQHSIKLLTKIDAIRLHGETAADIDLRVGMAGKNDSVLGFTADAYQFQLELERDGGRWFLISARWGELGEKLH